MMAGSLLCRIPPSVAIIGAGVSGLTTAVTLYRAIYGTDPDVWSDSGKRTVEIFDKNSVNDGIGGQWNRAYESACTQNTRDFYRLSHFSWEDAGLAHVGNNPTKSDVIQYWRVVTKRFRLGINFNHEVLCMEEAENPPGWRIKFKRSNGEVAWKSFDFVIVATGTYDIKKRPKLEGEQEFLDAGGVICTAENFHNASFINRRPMIVGFGKTALDLACDAARLHSSVGGKYGDESSVTHLFRKTRMLSSKSRLEQAATPVEKITKEFRSSLGVIPSIYDSYVSSGKIVPIQGGLDMLLVEHASARKGCVKKEDKPTSVQLTSGVKVPCDMIVPAVGSPTPTFSLLPQKYREAILNGLYRHIIPPKVPNLAFAGFNHSFLHIPGVEIASLWLLAKWLGYLVMPPRDAMNASISRVHEWKAQHSLPDSGINFGVSSRYHQYFDLLLGDLRMRKYRKMPNVIAEIFGWYQPSDYTGLCEEFREMMASNGTQKWKCLDVDM